MAVGSGPWRVALVRSWWRIKRAVRATTWLGGKTLVAESTGLGSLDGEVLGVQLLESIDADLLVTKLGTIAGEEGTESADTTFVISRVHLIGTAKILDVQAAVLVVVDVFTTDDGAEEPMCGR
jgi:hypothetical protein